MWTCASETRLRSGLFAMLALLAMVGAMFYRYQNGAHGPGGHIALPKLIWLAGALLYWYVLPALFLLDARLAETRRLHGLFLANMGLRAVIELWMMYVSHNWHPLYGIAHDVFSAGLSLAIFHRIGTHTPLARPQRRFYALLCAMFLIETGFAAYMLLLVAGQGPVYFVPPEAGHSGVLALTWATVLFLAAYLVTLVRSWLYVPLAR